MKSSAAKITAGIKEKSVKTVEKTKEAAAKLSHEFKGNSENKTKAEVRIGPNLPEFVVQFTLDSSSDSCL
jgi:hypothetical protein